MHSTAPNTGAFAALNGHLLGKGYPGPNPKTSFFMTYKNGAWSGGGTFSDSVTKTVELNSMAIFEVYNLYPQVAGWNHAPGDFGEAVQATCQLNSVEKCRGK
jgi:hypothetical protein